MNKSKKLTSLILVGILSFSPVLAMHRSQSLGDLRKYSGAQKQQPGEVEQLTDKLEQTRRELEEEKRRTDALEGIVESHKISEQEMQEMEEKARTMEEKARTMEEKARTMEEKARTMEEKATEMWQVSADRQRKVNELEKDLAKAKSQLAGIPWAEIDANRTLVRVFSQRLDECQTTIESLQHQTDLQAAIIRQMRASQQSESTEYAKHILDKLDPKACIELMLGKLRSNHNCAVIFGKFLAKSGLKEYKDDELQSLLSAILYNGYESKLSAGKALPGYENKAQLQGALEMLERSIPRGDDEQLRLFIWIFIKYGINSNKGLKFNRSPSGCLFPDVDCDF